MRAAEVVTSFRSQNHAFKGEDLLDEIEPFAKTARDLHEYMCRGSTSS
jgi:hypothetical protein